MSLKSISSILIVALLCLNILFSFNAHAETDVRDTVEARINITFKTATDLDITVECNVEKITLPTPGTIYTKSQIETISSINPEVMGAIKYVIKTMISEQITAVFSGSKITSLIELPEYKNNKFYDYYSVNFTYAFFDLNDTINAHDLVNGVLDMGSHVRYDFVFKANNGWDNTYILNLGADYEFKLTNGKAKENTIEWTLLNSRGELPEKEGFLAIYHKNPTSSLETEEITLDFYLDAKSKKTELYAYINLNSINLSSYNFLPAFISNLKIVPSDGLRLFVKNNLLSWDEIYQETVIEIEQDIKKHVETDTFNQTLSLVFSWDDETTDNCIPPYDVKNMAAYTPVRAILMDDEIKLLLGGLSSYSLFGLVNTGAKADLKESSINFGERLKNIGYIYNITLVMPEGIVINDKNNYSWNENKSFYGEMLSENAPDYKNEDIHSIIEIEVERIDLNILSLFTGEPKIVLGYTIKKEKNYNVTELPKEFSLPSIVDIRYLNSDALRLCIDENIFKESEIAEFLNSEKTFFENHIQRIIQGIKVNGNVGKDAFQETLQWDQDISKMSSENPITTKTHAYSIHSSSFHISRTSSFFKIPDQIYNIEGLKNQSVTYRIIFPKGVDITGNDEYGKAVVKQTNDGRQYIEISLTPEESDLSFALGCSITPSTLFLIRLFTPCIISIFVTLILIIVIILFRRKRKGGKSAKEREPIYEESDTGYEDQDYYIPPPPGSK
jgi:hypothetical protein